MSVAADASAPKVWLITGCSSGLGHALALEALARGDKVIATARIASKLDDLKARGAAAIALDVTSADAVLAKTVTDAVQIYGRIDILVNNAGYALQGAVEECSASEIYDQFNTNVFGITNVLRAVLPHMRAQKSGVIANVGSIAGWRGSSVTGLYSASKYAVAGISESLRAEVAHLGIEVTCIDFGAFRTVLFGDNMIAAKTRITDLDSVTAPRWKALAERSGHQRGDPVKAAKLLTEALTKTGRCAGRTLPSRLVVGKDAVEGVAAVLEKGKRELQDWADLATTTDCDDAAHFPIGIITPSRRARVRLRHPSLWLFRSDPTRSAPPSACEMATTPPPSGLVVVDVVLREQERVAALPSVVRAIRRFADATMLAKLKRAMKAEASATELDALLETHSEDLRLEALERRNEPAHDQERLPDKHASSVYDVFVYGAKRGSIRVVEWALSALPSIRVNGALRTAVNNGQLEVTQVLHPLVKKFGLGFTEDSLLNLAAARGHLEILQWMYANRRDPRSSCTLVASENAAKSGHLEVLKWILVNCPDQWSYLVLEQAALHNQQHVMDWIYEKRRHRHVTSVMESLAKKGAVDALMWLHEKYPENHLFLSTLKKMASHGAQLDLVTRIVTAFPESYAAYGIVIGVIRGNLEMVKTLSEGRRLKRREVKSAMCLAASYGFLDIVQRLSRIFADIFIPTKVLWRAVRCGHLNVICWIVEQKPELLTMERLAEMQKTSGKQPKTTTDRKGGDLQEVTGWIEVQQHKIAQSGS